MIWPAFAPHRTCYLNNAPIIAVETLGNLVIVLTFTTIAVSLLWIASKLKPAPAVLYWFAAFTLGCAATHLLDIVTIWWPVYWLDAIVRVATGALAIVTIRRLLPFVRAAMDRLLHDGQVTVHVGGGQGGG